MNPGWYDDPDEPGYLRYWDGVAWTDEQKPVPEVMTAPEPTAPAPPREAPKPTAAPTGRPTPAPSNPAEAASREPSTFRRPPARPPRATPEPGGAVAPTRSRRRWSVTFGLALVFGLLGAHRFYVGKNRVGIVQLVLYFASDAASAGSSVDDPISGLLTSAVVIWWLRDILWILLQRFTDVDGHRVRFGSASR